MTNVNTTAIPEVVSDPSGVLLVDSTALINFDRIGSLDTLLAAKRTVFITPEVYEEAVTRGLTSTNPVVFASAQRIASWVQLHSTLGDVSLVASDPNRPQFSGTGAGEASILADAAYLGSHGSNVVVLSDDNHVALSNVAGSP